ncbi:MAG: hypothetical protein AUH11_03155 [Acidobacteria bacterium 13_2_20CM_57_17]|nr:MAG: hypothetical protein AUH11_03155 [Acidobacteria bacterium 13_2_20CM_57_17]
MSHHNQNLDFQQIQSQRGILGVIHKATQGVRFRDPAYENNRANALSARLLWGAYHFGTGSDGVQQAEFFLDSASGRSDCLSLTLKPTHKAPA